MAGRLALMMTESIATMVEIVQSMKTVTLDLKDFFSGITFSSCGTSASLFILSLSEVVLGTACSLSFSGPNGGLLAGKDISKFVGVHPRVN
jgi:hypothetical protein